MTRQRATLHFITSRPYAQERRRAFARALASCRLSRVVYAARVDDWVGCAPFDLRSIARPCYLPSLEKMAVSSETCGRRCTPSVKTRQTDCPAGRWNCLPIPASVVLEQFGKYHKYGYFGALHEETDRCLLRKSKPEKVRKDVPHRGLFVSVIASKLPGLDTVLPSAVPPPSCPGSSFFPASFSFPLLTGLLSSSASFFLFQGEEHRSSEKEGNSRKRNWG